MLGRKLAIVTFGLGVAGCSLIFGLEDGKLRQDMEAGTDGGADATQDTGIDTGTDADAQVIPCEASTTTTAVVADTMLLDVSNPNPSIRYGKSDTVDLALNGTSRVIMRFTLGQAALAGFSPDGGVAAGKLTITLRKSGGACGATCPNNATSFQVYALNDGWNEGDGGPYSGAEWTNKIGNASNSQVPWDKPGAKGMTDASMKLLGVANVSASQAAAAGPIDVALTFDDSTAPEIRNWLNGSNLSLLLAPTNGGTLFLYSQEGMAGASQLAVTVCR